MTLKDYQKILTKVVHEWNGIHDERLLQDDFIDGWKEGSDFVLNLFHESLGNEEVRELGGPTNGDE